MCRGAAAKEEIFSKGNDVSHIVFEKIIRLITSIVSERKERIKFAFFKSAGFVYQIGTGLDLITRRTAQGLSGTSYLFLLQMAWTAVPYLRK